MIDAKNQPCTDCRIQHPWYVMQFDHVSDDKVFTIGENRFNVSMEALKAEIAKCEVVCANCHAIRTYKREIGT